MILIADSGSTKTDWCLVEDGRPVKQLQTGGFNPFFQTREEISRGIANELLPSLEGYDVESVYFYGAGCIPEKQDSVRQAITARLKAVNIEIGSDLLGAARSLCGKDSGIACILGTGSNSCFYDGKTIVSNISPLGFILGDEGSGAVLGRTLVGDCLKNQLPPELKEQFLSMYNLTPSGILERVYKQSFPNRFLAGLSPFLSQHLDVPEIRTIVLRSFTDFITRNVMQYDYKQYSVHFTGSIAYHYQTVLREVAQKTGICLGDIQQRPMPGLIRYHSSTD